MGEGDIYVVIGARRTGPDGPQSVDSVLLSVRHGFDSLLFDPHRVRYGDGVHTMWGPHGSESSPTTDEAEGRLNAANSESDGVAGKSLHARVGTGIASESESERSPCKVSAYLPPLISITPPTFCQSCHQSIYLTRSSRISSFVMSYPLARRSLVRVRTLCSVVSGP